MRWVILDEFVKNSMVNLLRLIFIPFKGRPEVRSPDWDLKSARPSPFRQCPILITTESDPFSTTFRPTVHPWQSRPRPMVPIAATDPCANAEFKVVSNVRKSQNTYPPAPTYFTLSNFVLDDWIKLSCSLLRGLVYIYATFYLTPFDDWSPNWKSCQSSLLFHHCSKRLFSWLLY